jgi:hypothetical protein
MNTWRVTEALVSFSRLKEILPQMTEEEVLRAIELEEETLRRKSLLVLLRRRAVRFYRMKQQEK